MAKCVSLFVIPAKTGIQEIIDLVPGFRRDDVQIPVSEIVS